VKAEEEHVFVRLFNEGTRGTTVGFAGEESRDRTKRPGNWQLGLVGNNGRMCFAALCIGTGVLGKKPPLGNNGGDGRWVGDRGILWNLPA